MTTAAFKLPRGLASDLEKRFFWWKTVGVQPRSDLRIVAQAMVFASFAEVRELETKLGAAHLVALLVAQPGWFDDRSWEFWRGRLSLATGRTIPDEPPRRSFDADFI